MENPDLETRPVPDHTWEAMNPARGRPSRAGVGSWMWCRGSANRGAHGIKGDRCTESRRGNKRDDVLSAPAVRCMKPDRCVQNGRNFCFSKRGAPGEVECNGHPIWLIHACFK